MSHRGGVVGHMSRSASRASRIVEIHHDSHEKRKALDWAWISPKQRSRLEDNGATSTSSEKKMPWLSQDTKKNKGVARHYRTQKQSGNMVLLVFQETSALKITLARLCIGPTEELREERNVPRKLGDHCTLFSLELTQSDFGKCWSGDRWKCTESSNGKITG